ncbi:MAG: 30S ribosomal protein S5 [Candidatus Omnitrophica bacterium]|nr:30S ribosomal protein S5 [Candidatus Omnitrophota bacterium]
MEEQKEQIKDPADTAEASINKIPVVEEQPPEPVRRKKTGGEENRFGKKAKIAFEKSADSEPVEEVISINRITKVTKGGKKLSFSALVVVGDTKGRVGYSLEKAAEVSIAIRKSIASAKKQMINVSLSGSTIPHEIIGRCGGATVLLKPAADGTGVIAAGPVRAVCDGVGIRNILTKCHRSNNPINVVKATMDGLSRLKTSHNLKKE